MEKNNEYIAQMLYEYSDALEALGNNPYRIRAYRRAAYVIQNLNEDIYVLVEQNFDLTSLPRIGEGIAYIIRELIKTNELPLLDMNLKQDKKINELVTIKGLGPKRIKILNEKYHIHTKRELLSAIKENPLLLGQKITIHIRKELNAPKKSHKFLRLYHAIRIIESILKQIKKMPFIESTVCCGEYRRKKETIAQFILIISSKQPDEAFKEIVRLPFVKYLLEQNSQSLILSLSVGIEMKVYCVEPNNWGSALLFYTGSEEHWLQLCQIAKQKKLHLNEKGLFRGKQVLATKEESDLYHHLKLSYIEPELREGRGEIEAAQNKTLPHLITLEDIRGDLHAHTNATDGQETIERMAQAAKEQGYEYLAITDHSKHLTITHGLNEKQVLQQIKHIDQLNAESNGILILKSIEVDILEDGSLDLSNDVLKELDIVVCSIHSKFHLEEKKQTDRLLKAMDNPYFNILGHATGRLIKSRPPYLIDMDKILQAARERHCFIELNAQPYRLDINDIYCKMAKEKGVKIAISSDAHTLRGLNFMELGIFQARRGWLEKEDVINTRSWPELKKLLRK